MKKAGIKKIAKVKRSMKTPTFEIDTSDFSRGFALSSMEDGHDYRSI